MGKCLETWKRLCLCLNPGTALEHSPATTQSALTSLAYSGRMFLLGQGPGEPPTSPGWKADALSLPPLEEGGCLYLDGKARRLLGTAGVTVCLATEGDSGWGFWAEIQVVVNKLAPLHEHEGSLLVHLEPLWREADDLVGHLSDLQGWRQNALVEMTCMNGCTQLRGHQQKFPRHFWCFADKNPQICLRRKVSPSLSALL